MKNLLKVLAVLGLLAVSTLVKATGERTTVPCNCQTNDTHKVKTATPDTTSSTTTDGQGKL